MTRFWAAMVVLSATWSIGSRAQAPAEGSREAIRFFEEQVRPILATQCQACHNEKVRMAGLSLASREAAMLGGGRGSAVIPGQPEESLMLQAVRRAGELKMPPTGPLAEAEIATLETWIQSGAAWGASPARTPSQAALWSLRPVERPVPPKVSDEDWPRGPIDRFILAKLEEKGLAPAPEADRRTLIRRASLDITGLPPTPAAVDRFLADDKPGAYERLVDRLLDSPAYGERWGRHWLDIAHYADSNGYSIDSPRSIWRYRDWVIHALNADMPFDRFTIEQFAGDLLPDPTEEQLIATGFFRNTMVNEEGGIDFEQYRVEAVVDRVGTVGAGYLGLTVGCARCHDHKFDPISQREFYQLFAFFNDVDELSGEFADREGRKRLLHPLLEFGEPDDFAEREAVRRQVAMLEADLEAYENGLDERQRQWEEALTGDELRDIPENFRLVLTTPREERNPLASEALARWYRSMDPGWTGRIQGLRAVQRAVPELEYTLVMRDLPEPRPAFIHVQGDFLNRGEPVTPDTPAVLPSRRPRGERADRLDLARRLVDESNPLTPRVTVNRMWQRYFGLGIVETENDFGTQGSRPTHPGLLDWLASEFVSSGWSLKAMHRLIATSATYRQSSDERPELIAVDPRNRLLGRQNRIRLEAESIRDAALVASGLLTERVGGPSVFPPQPEGAGQFTQIDRNWQADEGPDRYRRGLYTHFRRSAPHPGLALFDAPNAQEAVTRRNRSNTPLQALTQLNDEAQLEFSRALAARILSEAAAGERVDRAFEICLARPPRPDERERFRRHVAWMEDEFRTKPEDAERALDGVWAEDAPAAAAWTSAARVLLNLDEFVTRP